MPVTDPLRVLILYHSEPHGGDFGQSFAEGFRAHGCEVSFQPRQQAWRGDYELVLGYGPFAVESSMLPAARNVLTWPAARRPLFAWWLTEGIPPPWLPRWSVEVASRVRLQLDRHLPAHGGHIWARGHRLRIFGELRWLKRHGVLDVLAVTSASRATYLRRAAFDPIVVPLGYHPDYFGRDLALERDIDVCFVGNSDSGRRHVLLAKVTAQLAKRRIQLSVQTNLYGDERTRFLNRAKIMLNILRAPQDFVGQRFLLGAANRTLVERRTAARRTCRGLSQPAASSSPSRSATASLS